MKKPLGVIDLGTNTFHLLIAYPDPDGTFREVYRERRFIKLAEGGIDRIEEDAFERGLQAIRDYRALLDQYEVTRMKAFGTAALRTARNGPDFIARVKAQTGIAVEIIDGGEEARLIHIGVSRAVPLREHPDLIMDVGGGSVEFIIANRQRVYWAQSFPIGVAVLYERFQKHEPILPEEVAGLEIFLQESLESLVGALAQYPVDRLIGASGTFDVLEHFLSGSGSEQLYVGIPTFKFQPLYEKILVLNKEARRNTEGIPEVRADMIVVALILIRQVLALSGAEEIVVSSYAMKEGILAEMAGANNF